MKKNTFSKLLLFLFALPYVFGQSNLVFDPTFNPIDTGLSRYGYTVSSTDNVPHKMITQSDGKVIAINNGSVNLHGVNYAGIIRFNADGTIDETFVSPFSTTHPTAVIYDVVLQSDGKIIVVGNFTTVTGFPYRSVARLNVNGSLDLTFNGGANVLTDVNTTAVVSAVEVLPSNKIVIGGNFKQINGATRNNIAILNADGTLDAAVGGNGITGTGQKITIIKALSTGKLMIAGDFSTFNLYAIGRIARLNADLSLDNTFNYDTANSMYKTGFTGNSTPVIKRIYEFNSNVYLAMNYSSANNFNRYYNGTGITNVVLRLMNDGNLDGTFANTFPGGYPGFAGVNEILEDNGELIFIGEIGAMNGATINQNISKFTMDGTYTAVAGSRPLEATPQAAAITGDGHILTTGTFITVQGIAVNHIALLSKTNFALVPGYIAHSGFIKKDVRHIGIVDDQNYLVSGGFTMVNNTNTKWIVEMNENGTLNLTSPFGLNTNSYTIYKAQKQSNGKTIIIGDFLASSPFPTKYIARLNADGTIDNTFNTSGTSANAQIYDFLILPDGRIMIAGAFTQYNGGNQPYITILNVNGYPAQNMGTSIISSGQTQINKLRTDQYGRIYAVGRFASTIYLSNGGAPRNMMRYNADLTRDLTFSATDKGVISTGANIIDCLPLADGSVVLIGENLTTYMNPTATAGQSGMNNILRINETGEYMNTYSGGGPTPVFKTIVGINNTEFLVGGSFYSNSLIKYSSNGISVETYLSTSNATDGTVHSLTKDSQGRIYIGGTFSKILGEKKNGAARFLFQIAPPTGDTVQTYCSTTNPTVNNLAVTGSGIKVYDEPTGGVLLPGTTPLVNGEYYYVSQTIGVDESPSRLRIRAVVKSPVFISRSVTGCGEYHWADAGSTVYFDQTLEKTFGCDSIVELIVTIHPIETSTQVETACGQYTWTLNNQTYTTSGTRSVTLTNSTTGCDSIVYLDLTINQPVTNTITIAACEEYTWSHNGITYDQSGLYRDTLVSHLNCDSIVVLNLTINQPVSFTIIESACVSYTWALNNETYTTNKLDSVILTSMVTGCDSTVYLDLTIIPTPTRTITAEGCSEYTWSYNNQIYSSSGVYSTTVVNPTGCDSTVYLDLTIVPIPTRTITAEGCSQYTWSYNNQTYSSSGVYSTTVTNPTGCDSTVYLDLTIVPIPIRVMTVTACLEYTWDYNNQTYSASGVHSTTVTNPNGCDSTIYLDLTITSTQERTITLTSCNEYTWSYNNQTYSTSGVYLTVVVNQTGCDSTIYLDLTITSTQERTITVTACDEYTWDYNNQTYSSSGVYSTVVVNQTGCDSTIYLDLTISSLPDNGAIFDNGVLTASESNGTYQWYDCGTNQPISGATSQSYVPTENKEYKVVVTVGNCTVESACVLVNNVSLSSLNPSAISVYPNPAHSFVMVAAPLNTGVKLYDETGRILFESVVFSTETRLDIDHLVPGIYYMHVGTEFVQKVIKF